MVLSVEMKRTDGMKMRYRRKHIFKQTFQSLWKNKVMSLVSIGSITAVLIILGYILLAVLNINNIASIAKEEFDEIVVYIKDDTTDMDKEDFQDRVKNIDGVMAVVFKSKEIALQEVKRDWGDEADLLNGLRRNPLPDSFIVQLTDIRYSDTVIDKINDFSLVEDVKYYQDTAKSLITVSNTIERVGIVVILILLLICIFLISNTVKLTVVYRKKEIQLMQYIGATNGYIRGPFMLQGMILGILGAALAIVILKFTYAYATDSMTGYFVLLSGFSNFVVPFKMVIKDISIIFFTIGVGVGMLGSLISLKKFLSV